MLRLWLVLYLCSRFLEITPRAFPSFNSAAAIVMHSMALHSRASNLPWLSLEHYTSCSPL